MKTSFRFLFVALGFLVLVGCSWFLPEPEPGPGLYPDIAVYVNVGAREILSGSTYDFGNVPVGESVIARFTVANVGDKVLHMETGVPRTLNPLGVFVVTSLLVNSLPSQEEAPFSIIFTPVGYGPVSITVSIPNNDPDENSYMFTVVGIGVEPVEMPGAIDRITAIDSDDAGNVYVSWRTVNSYIQVTKFSGSSTSVVWMNTLGVGSEGLATGFVVSDDGTSVYRGYILKFYSTPEPHIERLDAVTGERVWIVASPGSPSFLDESGSYFYAVGNGHGARYSTDDGSAAGTWNGTERSVDSFVAGDSYFYYSGEVFSLFEVWPVWVRRSYDLTTTYDWFWNPWEEGFVNDPPHGGEMAPGNDALFGATREGVNYYTLTDGSRMWFLPLDFTVGWQYADQSMMAAASDGESLYLFYYATKFTSGDWGEVAERHSHLLKVSSDGEVVWQRELFGEIGNSIVLHTAGDILFVGAKSLMRFNAATGGGAG